MTKEQIETTVKSLGYKWFNGSKDYDLNIVGVRNSSAGTYVTNLFDDYITLSYKIGNEWKFHCWEATTDPGKKGVMMFGNPGGVATLVAGQYRGAYAISMHGGKYEAVCQRLANVTVWRDANKDMKYDKVKKDSGMFGINIHRSNPKIESNFVDNWSHGCQVFKKVKDFNEFMVICRKARDIWGNHFTYTLIETSDING